MIQLSQDQKDYLAFIGTMIAVCLVVWVAYLVLGVWVENPPYS